MSKARDLANIISGSGTLNANVIPDLPTSKITSGTFADARLSSSSVTQHVDLSNLNADNLTSGSIPSARISSAAVTQHVDLTSLSASNLTSGTVPSARLSLSESDVPNLSASKITSGTMDGSRISGGTFGSVNGSALTSLPSSAPTNSQILSGVASAGYQAIGSYTYVRNTGGGYTLNPGQTFASNFGLPGTWRYMYNYQLTGNNNNGTPRYWICLRIS